MPSFHPLYLSSKHQNNQATSSKNTSQTVSRLQQLPLESSINHIAHLSKNDKLKQIMFSTFLFSMTTSFAFRMQINTLLISKTWYLHSFTPYQVCKNPYENSWLRTNVSWCWVQGFLWIQKRCSLNIPRKVQENVGSSLPAHSNDLALQVDTNIQIRMSDKSAGSNNFYTTKSEIGESCWAHTSSWTLIRIINSHCLFSLSEVPFRPDIPHHKSI